MDRTELISFLEAEELRERERVELWRTAGSDGTSRVAEHTLRAERFAAIRRDLTAAAWSDAQSAGQFVVRPQAGPAPRFVMLPDPQPLTLLERLWVRAARWWAR